MWSGIADAGNPDGRASHTPQNGTNGRCAASDQRGTVRPIDGDADGTARCDIGAFEAPKPPDLSMTKTHTGSFVVGQNGVYTITVSNAATAAATTGTIAVTDTLPAGLTFVSATGTSWLCTADGPLVQCKRSTSIAPGASSAITLTVAVAQAAVPAVTNTATVAATNDFDAANNSASDPTIVVASCVPRPNVGLQVTQTGPGTGPGRLRAALTANTSAANPSNGITRVKILKATNADLDELGGQNNLSTGEVSFANVASTSFIVRRLTPETPPRLPFHVQIEVTDVCGAWKTIVGGGPNVP